MWIRSQDKTELFNTNRVYINFYEDIGKETEIFAYIANDNIKIGIYKTFQRAIEVLDLIQKELANILANNGCVVFEMPE